MSVEVYKGSALGPTESMIAGVQQRLFLAGGGHVVVRSDERPKARPRIEMLPNLADLARRPHIPRSVVGLWRLLAYCAVCQETVAHLPTHVMKGDHDIRYILLPDFRRGA